MKTLEIINEMVRIRNVLFSILNLFFLITSDLSSIAFVVKYLSTDLEGVLYAVLQVAGITAETYTLVAAYILRHDITDIFVNYQQIYEQNKVKDVGGSFMKVEERATLKSIFLMRYFLIVTPLSIITMTLTTIIWSIFTYGYINVEKTYHPFKTVSPWDEGTLAGFIIDTVYYHVGVCFILFTYMTLLIFFLSICEYHRGFYEVFQTFMNEVDTIAKVEPHSEYRIGRALYDSMEFHISATNLFRKTASVCSTFALVQLVGGMVEMTTAMFELDLAIQHLDFTCLLVIAGIGSSAVNLFIYCYYGMFSTHYYSACSEIVYQSEWVNLPVKLQKPFVLMIAYTQEPVSYHGFHIVDLNLETFTKIFKTVISYYLMIKTLVEKRN